MKLGYVGLGKMGKNMVLRLLEKGHEVVAWNRSPEPRAEVAAAGAKAVEDLEALVSALPVPRLIWLMLPAKEVTDQHLELLLPLLQAGDTIIDGSNSFYKDTERRAAQVTAKGVRFLGVGTSGGPSGARNGACLMIGGQQSDFDQLEPLFKDLAAPGAYQFFPGAGAGHFVKMVHNGIEYGMMQAIAEGFAIMKASQYDLNLEQVAHIYQQRSVIESRLVGWTETGFQQHGPELSEVSSTIGHLGEGEWTVQTAKELGIPAPVIEDAFQFRVASAANPSFTGKIVSMLRGQFGGHSIK